MLSLRQPKAVMDRDFILNVRPRRRRLSFVLCSRDGGRLAAVATSSRSSQDCSSRVAEPRHRHRFAPAPCRGDSMEQAKAGARRHPRWATTARSNCADRVRQLDQRDVRSAANATRPTSPRPSGLPRRSTQTWAAPRSATLCKAYLVAGRSESADIFLVTDGEVSGGRPLSTGEEVGPPDLHGGRRQCSLGGFRSRTRGRYRWRVRARLARSVADRVVRHFERMRAPRISGWQFAGPMAPRASLRRGSARSSR